MQPKSNASIGAWTLTSSRTERADDARLSFELVGSRTPVVEDDVALLNPITAARNWLADPSRRAVLAPALVARAEASVLVAERYFLEIDALANELAMTANADGSGNLDLDALDRIDQMIGVVRSYSERLRELLDPESPAPDADVRITAALAASRAGGLPAFVDAL
jgi:hypothetical protein